MHVFVFKNNKHSNCNIIFMLSKVGIQIPKYDNEKYNFFGMKLHSDVFTRLKNDFLFCTGTVTHGMICVTVLSKSTNCVRSAHTFAYTVHFCEQHFFQEMSSPQLWSCYQSQQEGRAGNPHRVQWWEGPLRQVWTHVFYSVQFENACKQQFLYYSIAHEPYSQCCGLRVELKAE